MTHPTSADITRLQNQLSALQMRCSALSGRQAELTAQHARLSASIGLAKARIELAPLATDAFTYLQEKAHARAVGEFEDLLSAFVADVIPDEAVTIRLELSTERGAPALDIVLDNKGNDEDILDGNGGGVTNVIVAALTYAALARTQNRPLVVLDEPDCWLQSSLVPNFTRVIAQVANPATDADGRQHGGIQTIMMSHNNIRLVDPSAHVLTLTLDDGVPVVASTSGMKHWDSSEQEGLRWIEVQNLRRHSHTRIPLCPGLNVLGGDISLGKSTLVCTALRALAYGDVRDSMVRHGESSAKVRVGLERDIELEMVRFKKPSAGFKTIYRKYVAGVLTNEGPMVGRSVPDFITETLRITRVDELDIQLRSQKQPVFLLNETSAVRARLLSVGRESGLLQSLIERHRLELKRDREFVKKEEATLNSLTQSLRALASVSSLSATAPLLKGLLDTVATNVGSHSRLSHALAKLEPLHAQVLLLQKESPRLCQRPESPRHVDTGSLARLIRTLDASREVAQVPDMPGGPAAPITAATQPLERCIAAIEKGRQADRVLQLLPEAPTSPELSGTQALARLASVLAQSVQATSLLALLPAAPGLPALADSQQLGRSVAAMSAFTGTEQHLAAEDVAAQVAERAAREAYHHLQHELGVCPVCSTPFKGTDNV